MTTRRGIVLSDELLSSVQEQTIAAGKDVEEAVIVGKTPAIARSILVESDVALNLPAGDFTDTYIWYSATTHGVDWAPQVVVRLGWRIHLALASSEAVRYAVAAPETRLVVSGRVFPMARRRAGPFESDGRLYVVWEADVSESA